jgi:hypothetical protein
MKCVGRPIRRGASLMLLIMLLWWSTGWAIPLDKDGDLKLGARMYMNARVGTQDTNDGPPVTALPPVRSVQEQEFLANGTFPHSNAGHLRQNRAFLEVTLKHDLKRLLKDGVGPLSLLNDVPFHIKSLVYQFTFRGEGDGLYDWGPREYSTARAMQELATAAAPINIQGFPLILKQGYLDVPAIRHQVRQNGTDRERLFQAFVEGSSGDLFVRVGRQLLSWGETDGFQLLDHINPLDSTFGGFLVPLDERRVPLDMIRADYYLGDFGPITEAFLQGYAAIDNKVGYSPLPPWGSPWTPPGLGAPLLNVTKPFITTPARTISNTRGGAILKFNAFDATFSVAHYYTYFDVPALQVLTNQRLLTSFNDGLACSPDGSNRTCGAPTHTLASAPKVQVTGASATFAVPKFYSIVRSEFAYFKDEPAFTQGQLDPFVNHRNPVTGVLDTADCPPGNKDGSLCSGGRRLRDSINAVVGLDTNQWIRFLNPNQTFLISTQFFYKHIQNAGHGGIYLPNCDPTKQICLNPDREVLPVPALRPYDVPIPLFQNFIHIPLGQTFISQPQDQFLHTLFVTTSYRSGVINPAFLMFYDWGGGFVYQPSMTLSRDPFRFVMSYSIIDSHSLKGGSGVSLLRDRDNVEFRLEYVI